MENPELTTQNAALMAEMLYTDIIKSADQSDLVVIARSLARLQLITAKEMFI